VWHGGTDMPPPRPALALEPGSCRRAPRRQGLNASGHGSRSLPPWGCGAICTFLENFDWTIYFLKSWQIQYKKTIYFFDSEAPDENGQNRTHCLKGSYYLGKAETYGGNLGERWRWFLTLNKWARESERNEHGGIDYGKGPANAFVLKWFYM
jgi:hypothetical protein